MEQHHKGKQGFASMPEERRREIAAMGGRSVPAEKRSFSKDPEHAARAGSKGGKSTSPAKRSFSKDHDLASRAGRKGGVASHAEARR
jgi:general stress protein YciG